MYSGDEVGYGKPPKSGQFEPGQSGNPRGRPKGSKNISTLMRKGLTSKVTANVEGQRKSMSALEVMVKQLIHDGLKGKPADRVRVLAAIDRYCPEILTEDTRPDMIEVTFISPEGHPDDMKPSEEERAFMRKALKDRRAEEKRQAAKKSDSMDFLDM